MKKQMRIWLLGVLLLSFHCLTAGELPTADYHWCFEGATEGKILPAKGDTAGLLLKGFDYEFVNARFGKAIYFGNTLQPPNTKVPTVFLNGLPMDFTKPFSAIITLKLDREACSDVKGYRAFKDILGNCSTRGPGARFSIFYGMFHFNSGDGKEATSVDSVAGKTEIPLGRWFQTALTYDGTTLKIYCDGLEVASGNINITAAKAPMRVGSHNGSAYNLPGAVDDLKLFTRALTPAEIAEYYLDFAE